MTASNKQKHSRRTIVLFLIAWGLFFSRGFGQTVEDRITSILNQMTVDEKILQLHQQGGMNTADNVRLRIPGFLMDDGPHGVRDGMATSYPVGIGMASTWDTALVRRIGMAMGEEFRGKGRDQALGPCLDIDRDPRNGRSPETGGEEPYLCGQITSALVRGIQSTPCIATVKHYNANHRENGRTDNNIIASQRVLHEHAGLAFRTAVQQGGAFCVMNAYNLINGQKCAENANLLTTILRSEWGFPFYVVSDWGSIWSSENAIKAGCDVCMGSNNYAADLPSLVSSGAVSQSVLDEAVRRVLRTKILSGMLDYQPPGNPGNVNSIAHQTLCRQAGRESLVLLKNQGKILPLDKTTVARVALIGPSTDVCQIDGSGSAYVTPFYTISPKQGIEQAIGASKVQYARGCDINSSDTSGYAAALSAAAGADAVIFCGGLDPSQEGEGFDRVGSSINLPGRQQDLLNRLAAVNPNLVAAIFSGGICGLENCINNIRGLIYAFYPGQEGGGALADFLFGDANPGGKLPVTMPKNDAQLPAWNDNFNDDYGCGYRWFDQMGYTPQFAFGYGLSYTTFSYSNLVITPSSVNPGEPVHVSVDVTNTGSRTGDEVVQLYLSDVSSTVWMPVKQLKGFRRVTLAPGQTSTVTFTLTADELYYYNELTASYDIEAGDFTVRAGGSSDNLPLTGSFTVLSGSRKPDLLIENIRMVPRYPLPGQKVIFLANVKNQGSTPTAMGVPLKVAFSVNGKQVCWSDAFTASIPTAGMALVCGNAGPGGVNTWPSDSIGTYNVQAVVDPDNTIDECDETNNTASALLEVFPRPRLNLALNKSVAVTSVEGQDPAYDGSFAVDGSMGTRWSSNFTDPQVIIVDLGTTCYIDDVTLYWEAAFGKDYYIRIAETSSPWVDVRHETAGDGGMDVIPVGANAQKVMMYGAQRGTAWGYSLWEFEIHGSTVTGIADHGSGRNIPERFELSDAYPNPFNPATLISYQLPVAGGVRLTVYDMLGREVAVLVNETKQAGSYTVTFDASSVASGMYLLRMVASAAGGGGGYSAVRKLLVLR